MSDDLPHRTAPLHADRPKWTADTFGRAMDPEAPLTEEDVAYLREIEGIKHLMPTPEECQELTERFPPPQSWYDEGEAVTD